MLVATGKDRRLPYLNLIMWFTHEETIFDSFLLMMMEYVLVISTLNATDIERLAIFLDPKFCKLLGIYSQADISFVDARIGVAVSVNC